MATIRKRGKRWQAMVRLAGCEPESRTFPAKAAAMEWARAEEARMGAARKLSARPTGRTLDDAIDRYTATALREKAATTRRSDIDRLRWWRDRLGHLRLSDVTKPLIAGVRDELARDRTAATVNRYLAILSAVLKRAAGDWGWLSANPVHGVLRLKEPPGRDRWLDEDEIASLFAACESRSHELGALVLLAFTTGMRQGELLALTWDRVDLARRHLVLGVTKNGDPRGIPLANEAVDALRSLPRRIDSPLVFRIQTQRPWNTYRRDFEQAMKDAGIKGATFHTIRHSVGTHLALAGVPQRAAMELLGHKTPAMWKRYSHYASERLRPAVEGLSQVLPSAIRRRNRDAAGEE